MLDNYCHICGRLAEQAHHAIVGQKKKANKRYRDWTHEKYNIQPLCREHHPSGQPRYLWTKLVDYWMERDPEGFMEWLERCPDTGINKRMEEVICYLEVTYDTEQL